MHVVDVIERLLVRLDSSWVLWFLVSMTMAGVVVTIERWVYFRSRDGDVHAIAAGLDARLARNDIKAALRALRPMRSMGAIVARAGLRLAPRGARAAEKGMRGAISFERKALEVRLVYLRTLAIGAPLAGAFGTIVATIFLLATLGHSSTVADPASHLVLAEACGALGKALVSTAVGVAVAFPAVVAHAYFQRRIAELLDDADAVSNLVLTYLMTRTPSRPPSGRWLQSSGPDEKSGSRKRPNPNAA